MRRCRKLVAEPGEQHFLRTIESGSPLRTKDAAEFLFRIDHGYLDVRQALRAEKTK